MHEGVGVWGGLEADFSRNIPEALNTEGLNKPEAVVMFKIAQAL